MASALLVTMVACGSNGDEPDASRTPSTTDPADLTTTTSTATSTSGAEPGAELPPAGALELEPYYAEQLAAPLSKIGQVI